MSDAAISSAATSSSLIFCILLTNTSSPSVSTSCLGSVDFWGCCHNSDQRENCNKYQLSDQYSDQSSDKNISFYLQRCTENYRLHTHLKTLDNHSLNNSWADWVMESKTTAHISSFGLCACTLAQWGDWTMTPSLRTSGIYFPHHKTSPTQFYSATATETLPTVKNCPMDRKV